MQLYDMDDLAESRRDAEEGMTDTCVIRRASAEEVYDPVTGKYTKPETVVYPTAEQLAAGNPGRCRLQSVRAQAANPEAGDVVYTVERVELQLPFGATFEVDDVATFTGAPFNPDLVGEKYRVTGLGRKSQATAQRLNVEVLT